MTVATDESAAQAIDESAALREQLRATVDELDRYTNDLLAEVARRYRARGETGE